MSTSTPAPSETGSNTASQAGNKPSGDPWRVARFSILMRATSYYDVLPGTDVRELLDGLGFPQCKSDAEEARLLAIYKYTQDALADKVGAQMFGGNRWEYANKMGGQAFDRMYPLIIERMDEMLMEAVREGKLQAFIREHLPAHNHGLIDATPIGSM